MIKSVLFIGNSHTYLHYMPQMLRELVHADDGGFELHIDLIEGKIRLDLSENRAGFLQKIAYETVKNLEIGNI